MKLAATDLIVNNDKSIYHLGLKQGDIADTIILVGDPGRVENVASFFDKIELKKENREFKTITGFLNDKRISVLSTGIGTDNIDIVLNELDALININFDSLTVNEQQKSLKLIRIGTTGALQADIQPDEFILSEKAIGFDGLLNFYEGRNNISDLEFEKKFKKHTSWNKNLPSPYVVNCSGSLKELLFGDPMKVGVTISAPGFYGPQGRNIRIISADKDLNTKIESFRFGNERITNYEMESSALYGLSKLLGHEAITICTVVANRMTETYSKNYHIAVKKLINLVLNRITE